MLVLVPLGCAEAPEPAPTPIPSPAPAPAPRIEIPLPAPSVMTAPGYQTGEVQSTVPKAASDPGVFGATERMIVRIGNIALVVDDVRRSVTEITALVESFEGYVVSSNSWREGERIIGTITIRVVAERFADVMRALRALAVDVNSESTSSKDVTEEYIDLSATLKNLEATEEQLLRLMEKAEKIEDILNVQRELSKTRGEIERTKGRLQYLERTSGTSLIEVHLEQASLDVNFTADKAIVKEKEAIHFTSSIAGGFAPYSYEWDFGDGNTSTGNVPRHAYKTEGSYTVSLKVSDDRGNTDTEIRSEYIVVLPGWKASGTVSNAWKGLVTLGHWLARAVIWAGIFIPVWIAIGGIGYGIFYVRRRWLNKKP